MSDSLAPLQRRTIGRSRCFRFAFGALGIAASVACTSSAVSVAPAAAVSHAAPIWGPRRPSAAVTSSNEDGPVPDKLAGSSLPEDSASPAVAVTSWPVVDRSESPRPNPGASHEQGQTPTAPLVAAVIQSTMRREQGIIKRRCWTPLLESRGLSTPSTARVTLTLVISPSGAVESVRNTVDAASYPALGVCIAARVRNWSFPPTPGPTTTTISFVFAGQ